MRRLLVWLLAALLVAPGTEALAVPTPAYPREWATMPTTFVDEILFGIPKGQGRRRGWKQARNQVLAAYAPAGLDVQVAERQRQPRTTTTFTTPEGIPIQEESLAGVPVGQIIAHLTGPVGYGNVNAAAPTAGILGLSRLPRKAGQNKYRRSYTKFLSHELGHVLGLDHSSDPLSALNPYGGPLPSPDDIAGLIGPEVGLPDPGDSGYRPPSRRRGR